MVRTLNPRVFRAPWPMYFHPKGLRKVGPMRHDKRLWPQNRFFPELNPKILDYTHVGQTGYVNQIDGKFVRVPEMVPELIVPDLSGFELKPYVSYRTDVEIEKRQKSYDKVVKEKGSKDLADLYTDEEQRWPPPKLTAKTLFDVFYADKVRAEFAKKQVKKSKD